jgi:hypothetical protein
LALPVFAGVTMIPSDAIAEDAIQVDAAYVKVALTHAGKTLEHPGFRVARDEQGVFVIECEGKNHEVAVVLLEGTSEQLRVSVEYSVDGHSVLSEELAVTAGEDARLSHGSTKLAINVDPRGKKDTSRKDDDKLDGPHGDDPLGGM